jgi:hypothetical protein
MDGYSQPTRAWQIHDERISTAVEERRNQREMIKELHAQGVSIERICKRVKCGVKRVAKILPLESAICELFDSGWDMRQIATALELDLPYVARTIGNRTRSVKTVTQEASNRNIIEELLRRLRTPKKS